MKKKAKPHARLVRNAGEVQGAYVIPARTTRPRPALIDEFVRRNMKLREAEQRLREIRAELKQGGRVDLARKFLQAPAVLRDLAGFLWRDEPFVIVDSPAIMFAGALSPMVTARQLPSDAQSYSERFSLEYSEERTRVDRRPPITLTNDLFTMHLNKLQHDVRERLIKADKAGRLNGDPVKLALREIAIECAWMLPLEEWACIFPDAAMAEDYDFILRITAAHRDGPTSTAFRGHCGWIARCWDSFEILGLERQVPALKHWSDKAACEFVGFISGERIRISSQAANAALAKYQKCKQRLGCHSEKPTLVTFAKYTRDGRVHRLTCNR
jgi:hypothetical protein